MTDERTDVEFMQRPNLWPVWPFLPLKRPGELGVLVELQRGVEPTVHLANLYMVKIGVSPTKTYSSFQALYDDGWRVD